MGHGAPKVMKVPRTVDLDITSRCNLRCVYCSHFGSAGDVGRDLPTGEWLTFFDELGRLGVMNVCLSGGEPFLRDDLETLIEGVVRNRMRFTVLTNGTLITAERAAFIRSTGRCDLMQVSLDGATSESHESCRGEGTFHRAVEGIRTARQSGISVTVRVTVHRRNVDDLGEITRVLLEDLGLPSFSTNAASPFGLCRENSDEVRLDPVLRQRAMESLTALNRQYGGRIQASAGPLAEAGMWRKMEEARGKGLEEMPGCGHLTACGGVMSRIAVRADGVMTPCTLLSHMELGRINGDSLALVWQNHPELRKLRERRTIPLTSFPLCADCEYAPFCTGGCPAAAYGNGGDENRPALEGCYRRFLDGGGRLPRLEL